VCSLCVALISGAGSLSAVTTRRITVTIRVTATTDDDVGASLQICIAGCWTLVAHACTVTHLSPCALLLDASVLNESVLLCLFTWLVRRLAVLVHCRLPTPLDVSRSVLEALAASLMRLFSKVHDASLMRPSLKHVTQV